MKIIEILLSATLNILNVYITFRIIDIFLEKKDIKNEKFFL